MNNIPYFLSHLPIWKANVKDTAKITKRNIKKTCSPSCGQKYRNKTLKPTDWVDDAIKMRQEGMILSDIALRVNRATSTVWKQLKLKGIE